MSSRSIFSIVKEQTIFYYSALRVKLNLLFILHTRILLKMIQNRLWSTSEFILLDLQFSLCCQNCCYIVSGPAECGLPWSMQPGLLLLYVCLGLQNVDSPGRCNQACCYSVFVWVCRMWTPLVGPTRLAVTLCLSGPAECGLPWSVQPGLLFLCVCLGPQNVDSPDLWYQALHAICCSKKLSHSNFCL